MEKREFTIDGVRYRFRPLKATPARRNFIELLGVFSPSVAGFLEKVESAPDGLLDMEVSDALGRFGGALGGALNSFFKALNHDYYERLVKTFIVNKVEFFDEDLGEWRLFTEAYAEDFFALNLGLEMQILGHCLKAQYSDFFTQLKRAGSALASQKKASN